MSDLDLDELIHTPEGRLVLEVLQSRRLPIVIVMQNQGEMIFWYPPRVMENLQTSEGLLEWTRLLEEHIARLQAGIRKN